MRELYISITRYVCTILGTVIFPRTASSSGSEYIYGTGKFQPIAAGIPKINGYFNVGFSDHNSPLKEKKINKKVKNEEIRTGVENGLFENHRKKGHTVLYEKQNCKYYFINIQEAVKRVSNGRWVLGCPRVPCVYLTKRIYSEPQYLQQCSFKTPHHSILSPTIILCISFQKVITTRS